MHAKQSIGTKSFPRGSRRAKAKPQMSKRTVGSFITCEGDFMLKSDATKSNVYKAKFWITFRIDCKEVAKKNTVTPFLIFVWFCVEH